MSSIAADLLTCLRAVERPGAFFVGGMREISMPAIEVDRIGRIAFPLLPEQFDQLIAVAEPAPYGRGEATLVDRSVRRTWQIDPGRVRIGGRRWTETLAELVAEAARGLGVEAPVAADFYKLLIYDAGSFFVDHRDTEKVAGMFATLAIVLPSAHAGGELIVRHLGREAMLALHPEEPSEIGFAAFYADCIHEVRPVTEGCRAVLVYNLRFLGAKPPQAPDYRVEERRAAERLRHWAETAAGPDKLVLPLEHAYTPAELSFATLKGRDAGVASVLVGAAAEAGCELHLALATIEESGSANPTGYRTGWRRGGGDEEEDDAFEVDEVIDSALTLSEWRRPDGGEVRWGEIPFAEDELCPADAFAELTPDEVYFREATGNEGASFERTYHRAGLVLWPATRRLAVLNRGGLRTTLPYLADLASRWEASGAATGSPLWREADALLRYMVRSWPRTDWRPEDDTAAGLMLDLQVRLGNAARIDAFLSEVSAEGHYAASDNAAILRAVELLPPERATELLVRIVARNAAAHLDACGELLRRCAAPTGVACDRAAIATALLDILPADPAKRAAPDPWHRPAPIKPDFVVDLLTATSRIDAGLAARAIEHVLAWPQTYRPDGVLVPAALALAQEAESATQPAAARLHEAALAHLRRRIALPLEPPRDWARPNPLRCDCADCRELGAFLLDPRLRQWRLKAVQSRRSHVEENARRGRCDLDLATERRGSPHTLVATKNQASYDRRTRQRQRDLQHLAALGG